MIRYITAGESHGPGLTGIVEGVPAGLTITEEDIAHHLVRRQQGYGRGGRMAFEKDFATINSGVRFSKTMGGPIAMHMPNRAFKKDDAGWPTVMNKKTEAEGIEKITLPRPGHADLVGAQKYNFDDIRPVIERSSARETAMRVACCSIARQFLKHFGIEIGAHVLRIGSIGFDNWEQVRAIADPLAENGAEAVYKAADESDVRCLDEDLSAQMREEIKVRRKQGSSLGGIYEILVTGLPAGLGSYVHWDRKLDGQLAQAIMGTQAMKGVEVGLGFESGHRPGHEVHDEITHEEGSFKRRTNRMGGIEGGMTTGMPLIIRGVMKPIPTMLNPLSTVDMKTKQETETRYERSDVCALPRAVVVAESVIAPVLANAFLEKFGGDSISDIEANFKKATQ
ncbi:chorismate synthase [Gracilimonas mengyeensis]|uniref:Chorismate synthase n=1 Tax=Gracilimonas mengyeensis TaxID=1302730 RepID=A0A521CHD5_9BACT|nr:chorismate synthase [Gracilimonas mengyeensis]SMO58873.1 chorismate synthase [Gracilimonas mengyeensis]